MNNLFSGKNDASLFKRRTGLLHAAILPVFFIGPSSAFAAHFPNSSPTHPTQTTCWETAGTHFGIDPLLLKAIAWKESRGRPHAIGQKLKDGNVALGLMQINTIHLPKLKQFGIDRGQLFNACTSQQAGAWVLADCISKFGATWKAVGCYYTGPRSNNVDAQVAYVNDVRRFYGGYRKQAQQRLVRFSERTDQ